jgi:hypothetical protein
MRHGAGELRAPEALVAQVKAVAAREGFVLLP